MVKSYRTDGHQRQPSELTESVSFLNYSSIERFRFLSDLSGNEIKIQLYLSQSTQNYFFNPKIWKVCNYQNHFFTKLSKNNLCSVNQGGFFLPRRCRVWEGKVSRVSGHYHHRGGCLNDLSVLGCRVLISLGTISISIG